MSSSLSFFLGDGETEKNRGQIVDGMLFLWTKWGFDRLKANDVIMQGFRT